MKNIHLRLSAILCSLLAVIASQHSTMAANHAPPPEEIRYVATIQPLAAILEQMTKGRGEVIRLLSPGSSPHTFDPRPSDAVRLERAIALVYAGPGLDKEWTAKMPAAHRIEMLHLVPEDYLLPMIAHEHEHEHEHKHRKHRHRRHETSTADPHFWTDPLAVKAMLPALAEELSALDADGRAVYHENAGRFAAELDELHNRTAVILEPVRGRAVLLFHPSFQYLLKRYGLEMAGIIEPFPGREPSPRALHELIRKTRDLGIQAVFTEPQLSPRPAQVIAEAANLKLYELDPIGGIEGRRSYEELILYNARTLATALQ
jgi:zinc transport system substrate-binding protein